VVAGYLKRSTIFAGENQRRDAKRIHPGAVVYGRHPLEVHKMLLHPPLLSPVCGGVLDMTADFAPLFVGMVVGLGVSILGLVFAIGVHDTRWARRKANKTIDRPVHAPDLPDAA